MVEVDLDFEAPYPDIRLISEKNIIDRKNRIIQYELDNDPNRENMYAIFQENK